MNSSYIIGFVLFSLELQEWKLSLAACILINFLQKKPHTGAIPIVQESLTLFRISQSHTDCKIIKQEFRPKGVLTNCQEFFLYPPPLALVTINKITIYKKMYKITCLLVCQSYMPALASHHIPYESPPHCLRKTGI